MTKKHSLFLAISIAVGGITYIALENIYYALGVSLLFIVVSFALLVPLLNIYEIKVNKYHECCHFINNFVIALSIKKSIKGALESTVNSMPQNFIDIYEGIDNMNDHEKINYLSTYFPFHVYKLFIQVVSFWEEDGGDILSMSKYLINDARDNEEYLSRVNSLNNKKYGEISVLWVFCLIIVVILRFSLKDFYEMIKGQLVFSLSVVLLMVFVLFSSFLLIKKATKIDIKGYVENEKNA